MFSVEEGGYDNKVGEFSPAVRTPLSTVIIASKGRESYLRGCLNSLLDQVLGNIEIICIVDSNLSESFQDPRVRIVVHNGSPSEKRNLGIKLAKSDYLAFIDDDAQAPRDWILKGTKFLEQEEVVGGPNLVHQEDTLKQRASDAFYSSKFGSFREVYRYRKEKGRLYADNLGTVNLFIRKSTILRAGGFDGNYWPGEDTNLCERLKKKGVKLRYSPELFVYHHRRDTLIGHVKQIWRYAVYRGTSFLKGERNYFYFLPSILLLLLIALIAISIAIDPILLLAIVIFAIAISFCAFLDFYLRSANLKVALLGLLILWPSHLAYSTGVIRGLLRPTRMANVAGI